MQGVVGGAGDDVEDDDLTKWTRGDDDRHGVTWAMTMEIVDRRVKDDVTDDDLGCWLNCGDVKHGVTQAMTMGIVEESRMT